jgi:hypothetical protein
MHTYSIEFSYDEQLPLAIRADIILPEEPEQSKATAVAPSNPSAVIDGKEGVR